MKPICLLVLALCVPAATAAVSANYTENFDSLPAGDNVPAQWTEPSAGAAASTIIDRGGNKVYNVTTSSTATSSSVGLAQVTNLANPQSFTASVQFSLRAVSSASNTFVTNGMLLFSDAGASSYYRVIYNTGSGNNGRIEVVEIGSAAGMGAGTGATAVDGATIRSTGTLAPVFSTSELTVLYTLTATVTYTGSTMNFQVSLTNGLGSVSMAVTDTSPKTGTYFGLRTATSSGSTGSTTSINVDYDNFDLALVPEPSSALLAILGASGILLRGRRR